MALRVLAQNEGVGLGGVLAIQRGLHRVAGKLVTMQTKTRRLQRTIPLPALVVAALERHRDQHMQERADLGLAWQDSGHVFTHVPGDAA